MTRIIKNGVTEILVIEESDFQKFFRHIMNLEGYAGRPLTASQVRVMDYTFNAIPEINLIIGKGCDHDWRDATNSVISYTKFCVVCGELSSASKEELEELNKKPKPLINRFAQ